MGLFASGIFMKSIFLCNLLLITVHRTFMMTFSHDLRVQIVAVAVFSALAFSFYVFFVPFLGSNVLKFHVVAGFSPLVSNMPAICETPIFKGFLKLSSNEARI